MKFTEDQQKAIDTLDKEVVVSAAAGSGKTAVLVERILKRITLPNEKGVYIDIDQLLVVTFTKAAAAEMKERLTKALSELIINTDPTDLGFKQLRRQLFLLNKANITTIDAFCRQVVMQSFHFLSVDSGFKTLDPKERPIMISKCIKDLFSEKYDNNDTDFLELVEIYGGKYSDESLSDLVLQIYEKARGNLYPKEWIKNNAAIFSDPLSYEKIYKPILESELKDILNQTISDLFKILDHAEKGVPAYINPIKEKIEQTKSAIYYLEKHTQLPKIKELLDEFLLPALPAIRSKADKDATDDEHKNQAQSIFKKIKSDINKLAFISEQEATKELAHMSLYITNLSNLVLDFYDLFEKTKIEQNLLDFSDLNHFAIEALSYPEVKANFSYEEVFIDEYQDSNHIQEFILSNVAKTRFIVGDIKQSIYRFRAAVPELFNDRLKNQNYIALKKNFRSRNSIITGTNHIFHQILPLTDIEYEENAMLHLGASYPDIENDIIEIHIAEADDTDIPQIDLEAGLIVSRIKSLLKAMYVSTKDGQRLLQYSDIAILARNKKHMPALLDYFKNFGIPAVSESNADFFQTQEIMTIISWLQIVDNPIQDIPLLAVLNSPIYDITPDQWVTLRKSKKGLFKFTIKNYIEQGEDESLKNKLQKFLQNLQDFRDYSTRNQTKDLIIYILEKTDYLNHVAKFSGQTGIDNINILIEQADFYIKKDLYSFIIYVEQMIKRKVAIGEAIGQGSVNAINIMTIHKSKGLEYPVVFVFNLGRNLNENDEKGDLLIHNDLGFGPKYIDLENRIKKPSISTNVLSNIIKKERIAEEVRLLYVAATRAKEKLIFVSAMKNIGKQQESWSIKHNKHSIFSCKNYMDMIMPCFVEDRSCFDIKYYYPDDINQLLENMLLPNIDSSSDQVISQVISEEKNILEPEFVMVTPYKGQFTNIPANLTISQIKGNGHKQKLYESEAGYNHINQTNKTEKIILELPAFMVKKHGLSPTQVGNAHHTVMEHIDFGETDVLAFVNNLYEKGFLTEEEKDCIKPKWINDFLQTDLAVRMKNADVLGKLHRETPFAMKISRQEAYLVDYEEDQEKILVHGIIDTYFEEGDSIVLVDYKTDNIKSKEKIKERYQLQIDFYKKALNSITGKKVTESIIYMLATGEIISIS